jgi:LmbE family N-acetylglucosaminyl deacetylase
MKNKTILVFSPHADDVEISMGGTIAKLSKENDVKIITCIVPDEGTDGNKDKYMIENRYKEQVKAAEILGADLEVLNISNYDFTYNRTYVKQFDDLIKKHNPDVVFSCWEHDTHQDHQTLAKIIYSALRKNNRALYQYGATTLGGGLNSHAFHPNLWIDISGEPLDQKIKAMEQYKYYIGSYIESIVARSKFQGGQIGVDHAETFLVIKQLDL